MGTTTYRRMRNYAVCFVPLFALSLTISIGAAADELDSLESIEDAAANPSRVDLQQFCSQKNQGGLGTCHAFALSCPIEALENRNRSQADLEKAPYKVSVNWLVFVSVLDRICRSGGQTAAVNRGYDPKRNVARLQNIGYCSEQSYSKYDPHDRHRSINPLFGSRKGAEVREPASGTVDRDVRELYRYFFGDEPDSASSRPNANPRITGVPGNSIQAKFKAAFGISQSDAHAVFCGSGNFDAKVKALAARSAVSEAFVKCFDEAKRTRPKIAACKPDISYRSMSSEYKKSAIKEKLKRGEPVMISVMNYPRFTTATAGHTFHAISLRGYDDEKGVFLAQNSWGSNANYPIPYSRLGFVRGFGSLNCDPSTPPSVVVNPPKPDPIVTPQPPVVPPKPPVVGPIEPPKPPVAGPVAPPIPPAVVNPAPVEPGENKPLRQFNLGELKPYQGDVGQGEPRPRTSIKEGEPRSARRQPAQATHDGTSRSGPRIAAPRP